MNTPTTYSVIAIYNDREVIVNTNSANVAISALFEHFCNDVKVDVVNNYTGEVLATVNYDEPYITEEWSLMILGWLMQNN